MKYFLECVSCKKKYRSDEIRYRCDCGEILEVKQELVGLKKKISQKKFDNRLGSRELPYQSGVWRYKEIVLPIEDKFIISRPEGNTNLYHIVSSQMESLPAGRQASGHPRGGITSAKMTDFIGLDEFYLKHEGENPTGSFKDRGMTVGISVAKKLGMKAVACASTGNTSSSLASYAALAKLKCFVFLPKGKISASKLAQSIGYGAYNIQIDGDFDKAMGLVEKICNEYGIYLLNSINPYRIEGQKSILFELLQQLNWNVPDWIVLPGGNLGNTAALGKGLLELHELGIIRRLPKIAVIQARGANPFYRSFREKFKKRYKVKADTIASAIRIGNPVSFLKAKNVIEKTDGIVEEVSDREILDAKAMIDASGIGCEPASASTIAGLKKLVSQNNIKRNDQVVGILTGHILKDPDTVLRSGVNNIIEVDTRNLDKKIRSLL